MVALTRRQSSHCGVNGIDVEVFIAVWRRGDVKCRITRYLARHDPPLAAGSIDQPIRGNRIEPWAERTGRIVGVQRAVNGQQRLLDYIVNPRHTAKTRTGESPGGLRQQHQQ